MPTAGQGAIRSGYEDGLGIDASANPASCNLRAMNADNSLIYRVLEDFLRNPELLRSSLTSGFRNQGRIGGRLVRPAG